jgi:hypothetical protein
MTDLHNSITIPPQEIHNLADYKPGGLQNLLISSSNHRFHHQIIDLILILAIAMPPSTSNKLFTLQNSEHFDKWTDLIQSQLQAKNFWGLITGKMPKSSISKYDTSSITFDNIQKTDPEFRNLLTEDKRFRIKNYKKKRKHYNQ